MGTSREILEQIVGDQPLSHLQHPKPEVRRLAVAACVRLGAAALEPLSRAAASDPDEEVRAEAVEVLGGLGEAAYESVWGARDDPSTRVLEATATAFGEIGDESAVPWLNDTAAGHDDPLVREAAIAALGALGDSRALPALLEAAKAGKPQIRRRAVVALTAFEGPEVEAALAAARLDRNPMVREVAEAILGRKGPESDDGGGAPSASR